VSDDENEPQFDSIAAAKRLSKSTRLRALLLTLWGLGQSVWPLVYPPLLIAGGWVAKSFQTDRQFADVRYRATKEAEAREALTLRVAGLELRQQRESLAIGKQCAYATGAALGGETPKAWSTKRKDGDKYLGEYERLTQHESPPQDPQTALNWLFFRDR